MLGRRGRQAGGDPGGLGDRGEHLPRHPRLPKVLRRRQDVQVKEREIRMRDHDQIQSDITHHVDY